MIHLIYTSIPLQEIPEQDRNRLLNAVDNWGDNHSFGENDPKPNFMIRKIGKGKDEKLEWRRMYSDVLRIPSIEVDCLLRSYGSTTRWSWYVESVAVATNVLFRKHGVRRFSGFNDKTRSSISEYQDGDGLNRLQLNLGRKTDLGHFSFTQDLKWLQDETVFFLEIAAIYHLAEQALRMGRGQLGNPRIVAMCKKLDRIQGICTLEEYNRKHEPDPDEEDQVRDEGWYR